MDTNTSNARAMNKEQPLGRRLPSARNATTTQGADMAIQPAPRYDVEHAGCNEKKALDPFGDETNAVVKYKTMKWWQAAMLMIAETIALGILALPSVLAAIGIVPALILLIGLGIIAIYTGYTLGQFKLRYPHVHNMADAGEILFGPIGRELLGAAQVIFFVFVLGAHILTASIMFNTLTGHATCTIVWSVIAMLICLVLTLPRTLHKVSFLCVVSFISILGAVLITMIALGLSPLSPLVINATHANPFFNAFLSVTNIIFAYGGHATFFPFMSEMRDPREYYKALFVLQGIDISLYVVVAVVIYRYAGNMVASPALGSTSPLIQKIAYGIAIPTIFVAGIINGHLASKYILIRIFRKRQEVLHSRSWTILGAWGSICVTINVIAWIIAEAIPVFGNLLGIISALFISWFTYGLGGVFWFHLNKGHWMVSKWNMMLTVVNIFIIVMALAIMGLGLYASGKSIHDSPIGKPFSC